MKNNTKFLLGVIFIIALALRIYRLVDIPFSFGSDEVTNAYVGRYILLNGKDLYGNSWPLLYFDKFGDYPPVLPMYLAALPTFLFGVNIFASRFMSALIGSLIIFPIYSLAQCIFKNKKIALLSAFIIAIMPWHIMLSRAGAECVLGLTIFTTGIALVLNVFINNKISLVGLFLLFLSYFVYPSFRILSPLVLLPLAFMSYKNNSKKWLGIIAFFIFVTIAIGSTTWGRARFSQTSLFSNESMANQIKNKNEALSFDEGQNNILLARIFHNKIIGYSRELISQYLSYFSPNFLLLEGGLPFFYGVPNLGMLLISFIVPFLFLPLVKTVKSGNRLYYYLIYLLIISPIPAALTTDFVPNVLRSVFMIIPLSLLISLSLYKMYLFLSKIHKTIFGIFLFIAVLEYIYFIHQYINHSASYKSGLKNDRDKEIALYIKENKGRYNNIFVPDDNRQLIYYLFFSNNFDSALSNQFRKGLKIDKVENITFINDKCPSGIINMSSINEQDLIIDTGNCQNNSALKLIQTIYNSDSTRSYKMLIKENNDDN